jgi:hypothetical protein
MEKDPARQYFYNPWLLQLCYTRALFIEQLCTLYRVRGLKSDDKATLLRRSDHAHLIVTDVHQLTQLKLCGIDWSDVNFECALYRLATLCQCNRVPLHKRAADPGELWACEQLIQIELAITDTQHLMMSMIRDYIGRVYIRCCEVEHHIIQRYKLLHNAKLTMEQEYVRRYNVQDLCVEYSRPLVATMMLCTLLEELRADVILQLRAYSHPLESHSETPQELKEQLALCEVLVDKCKRQYVDEFYGFAVVQSPVWPECNERYTLLRNPLPSVWIVEETRKAWRMRERDTGPCRYRDLNNSRQRNHYTHIVRRFLFDCALRRRHSCDCTQAVLTMERPGKSTPTTGDYRLQYNKVCHTCRYFDLNSDLTQFYARCEAEQTGLMPGDDSVLAQWLIASIGAANSLVYWMLCEVQLLFDEARFVLRPFQYCVITACQSESSDTISLFQMLDLSHLLTQLSMKLQQCCLDSDATELMQRVLTETEQTHIVTELQRALVLRATLIHKLLLCVDEQHVEVESYERSLNNVQLSVNRGSSRYLHEDVCRVLNEIATLYTTVLKKDYVY